MLNDKESGLPPSLVGLQILWQNVSISKHGVGWSMNSV